MSIPEDLQPAYNHAQHAGFGHTSLTGNSIAAMIERISTLTEQLDAAKAENDRLRAALDKATGPVRDWWFKEVRPIINAIGEISVQEAMDAVERDLK